MEILGVGPLELFFIILIALIIFGPQDMVKAGRSMGRFLRKLVTSDEWRTITNASRELSNLPTKLMREAGIEEDELRQISREVNLSEVKDEINKLQDSITDLTVTIPPITIPEPSLVITDKLMPPPPEPTTINTPSDPPTASVQILPPTPEQSAITPEILPADPSPIPPQSEQPKEEVEHN